MSDRRSLVGGLIGLAVGGLIVLLVVSILQTRGLAGEIRETQKVNTGTVELIKDCTQPAGKCFKRGQARTASAVADINRVAVIAAACVDERGTQTVDEIKACVMQALTKEKP